jgi:two-component system chemotaxis response regulator CheY
MSKKILVVDDSANVRQQVRMALNHSGFQVVEAVDGVDGKAVLDRRNDISLVICDVNMPEMCGIDMLEALRAQPEHSDLPVVMLTTEGQPASILRARKAGADGWIIKPFKADFLVATVHKLTA